MKRENYKDINELLLNYKKISLGKAKNLQGLKFERLEPLFRVYNSSTSAYWACKCDCGNFTVVRAAHLISKAICSCGCFKRDNAKNIDHHNKPNHIDLTGQKFGKLTALEFIGTKEKSGHALWKCQCECGNIINVSATHLKTGHTFSCGCNKRSKYEQYVEEWLKSQNLLFKKEVSFKELGKLRFDFVVYKDNIKYFIEVQGQQHYQPVEIFGGIEEFKKLKRNDDLKKDFCLQHNYPFLALKYNSDFNSQLFSFLYPTGSTTIPQGE